jgi:hypothetical protein
MVSKQVLLLFVVIAICYLLLYIIPMPKYGEDKKNG